MFKKNMSVLFKISSYHQTNVKIVMLHVLNLIVYIVILQIVKNNN